MKKIIFVHLLNDYSGSPKVLSQVIKSARENGFEIELYTGKGDDGFLSGLTDAHHHYFYKRFRNKYLTLIMFMLSQLILFFKLLKYWNEDVVIYVNTMLPFGAGLAGKIMGKPVYYHVHETYVKPASFKRFLRAIIQISASKIIYVSKYLKDAEPFKNINASVIYNALPKDSTEVAEKSQHQFKKNGQFNVLMICSLKAYKGVYEFISIAFKCEQKKDITFTLVLNAEQSEIDTFFQDRKLPSNLTIIPRQQNVIPFYENSSLLLNLSRVDEAIETFGLTIIEAMAFCIPVIVPPVGGPAEIIRDGVEGYLISSYEIDKIANTIMALSHDEAKCIELSNNAKIRSADFKESVFEKNILEVISE